MMAMALAHRQVLGEAGPLLGQRGGEVPGLVRVMLVLELGMRGEVGAIGVRLRPRVGAVGDAALLDRSRARSRSLRWGERGMTPDSMPWPGGP